MPIPGINVVYITNFRIQVYILSNVYIKLANMNCDATVRIPISLNTSLRDSLAPNWYMARTARFYNMIIFSISAALPHKKMPYDITL